MRVEMGKTEIESKCVSSIMITNSKSEENNGIPYFPSRLCVDNEGLAKAVKRAPPVVCPSGTGGAFLRFGGAGGGLRAFRVIEDVVGVGPADAGDGGT